MFSISVPTISDVFQLSEEQFTKRFKDIKLPEKDDCNLVFQCKSGSRSQKAVDIVKALGYKW